MGPVVIEVLAVCFVTALSTILSVALWPLRLFLYNWNLPDSIKCNVDKIKHISHLVPMAEGSAEMKMFLILLNIGLTFADKLDRTYLPPPGSVDSGGSPGAINVPFELPETNYSSKERGFSKRPELVIGIDRAGPYQEDNTFRKEISPSDNFNSFNSLTEIVPSIMDQFSQFPEADKDPSPNSVVYHNADHPLNGFDISQQFHNFEKHPIIDEHNRVYLPPFIDNMKHTLSSVIPSLVNIENDLSNEYKYTQHEQLSDEHLSSLYSINQPFYDPTSSDPSIITPNHSSIDMKSNDYQIVPTNFIKTIDSKKNIFDKISIQKPERIHAEFDRKALIINYGQTINPDGYAYGYDTSNGIRAEEEGTATNGVKAKGSYSYIGDDGNVYEVTYTADENGFLPKGAHLPTAPPIPDIILKVIEQAVRDKEAGVYDDGSYDEEKYGHKKYQDRYPQTNNNINADFVSENGINNAKNYEFFENEESQGLKRIIGENFNKFENNANSRVIPNKIQNSTLENDSKRNSDLQNINKSNTNLNKNDYELSLQQPENKSLSNEQTTSFENTDLTISDKDYIINQNKPSGYEYFAPTNAFLDTNNLQSFPPRFLGIQQDFHRESQQNNLEKVAAKPFLTPYVSRKGDDSEVKDFDEEGDHQNNDDDPIHSNYLQKTIEPIELLTNADEPINSLKFIPGQQPQFGKRIQNQLVSPDKEVYYYQNANKPTITLNPRVSYTSTATPTELPSLISTTQQVTRTFGRDQTAFQTKTSPLIDTSSTKSPLLSLPTQTTSSISLNESKSAYPGADLISTPKSVQTSRPGLVTDVPIFSMTPKPSTSITNYPDFNNGVTSTESVFGEDFSGPKQPQQFDHITGYHY
ncbi:uncharacterized protein LOC120633465 [Pararge aegeria]|uniref:uncharacterized protein LOC120633465 n=1 Tax=Pararge aegeria TaxID=116150 RepID=UPI0019CF4D49|nr:uncharacterized protein LOC120633465 [Pararge aegeria]